MYSVCFFKLVQKSTNCWKNISHSYLSNYIFLKKWKYSLSYLFNYFESVHTTLLFGCFCSCLQESVYYCFSVFLPRMISNYGHRSAKLCLQLSSRYLQNEYLTNLAGTLWPHMKSILERLYILSHKTSRWYLYFKLILKKIKEFFPTLLIYDELICCTIHRSSRVVCWSMHNTESRMKITCLPKWKYRWTWHWFFSTHSNYFLWIYVWS